MNLRDLMTRLDTIAEADVAGADPQRAAYDKFKADDAKTAAIATVKKYASIPLNQIPRLANAIDPKTGIIYYGDPTGESGEPQPKKMPFQFMAQADQKSMMDALTLAGLKVTKTAPGKGMFGEPGGYAMVDPRALADIDKPRPGPTPGPSPVRNTGDNGDGDAAKLDALVAQLEATLGGDIAPMPSPPTPPPNWKPPINPQTNKPFSWKEFLAATAVSAMPGAVIGGVPGAAVTGLTGGAVDAYHQLHKQQEGIEFNSSIAQALVESFGYQLNEVVSVNPEAPGFMQTKLNVADPTTPAFNPNQKYADALARQDAQAALKAGGTVPPATAAEAPKIAAGLEKAGVKTVAPDVAKAALKAGGGKILSKLLPGVGLVVGTVDAIKRAEEGDWTGAAMAGASAMLSLVPGVGGVAAMGLDAANLARDYKAGKFSSDDGSGAPTGTTTGTTTGGGDAKLVQLQKMIGAKPDGLMGPETKAKLQAWQQKNGLTPDGMPGPLTYGKAGIKEQQQTVAEGIRNLQERLALIETKSIIRESIKGQHYFLDANTYFLFNESGEMIADLTTIAAINEAHANGEVDIEEGLWSDVAKGVMKYGGDAVKGVKNFVGSAVKGGANPAAAAKLAARDSEKLAAKGLSKSGLKTSAAIAKNPKTAAALAIGGGAGLGYALGGETGTNTGDGTGGIGGSETGTTTAPTPSPSTPNDSGKLTPEQQELVKQIHALMMSHGDDPNPTPVWMKSAEHAQAVLDKAEHASTAQTDQDKKAAAEAAATAVAGEKKAADTGGSAASPTGTTNPLPKVPAGTDISKSGTTMPDPTLKVYKEDDELARWLKIARG